MPSSEIEGESSGKNATDSEFPASRLARERAQFLINYAQVCLSLTSTPRYQNLPIAALHDLVAHPLVHDRIAIASISTESVSGAPPVVGVVFWASVSDSVDTNIRAQISAGAFPVKLAKDEWVSGKTIWVLDLIAPDKEIAAGMLLNLKAIIPEPNSVHVHPKIANFLRHEVLDGLVSR